MPRVDELASNTPSASDLVELVDARRARRRAAAARHAGSLEQRRAAARDDSAGSSKSSKPSLRQHLADRREEFRLDDRRRRSDRVDVALIELAEPSARRPVRAPDRLNLIALEELRQLVLILRDRRAPSGTVRS